MGRLGRPGRTGAATLVAGVLALGACGGDGAGADESAQPAWLADPASVATLIEQRFPEPPTLRLLTIMPDTVRMEVRDPAVPENIDVHAYYADAWHVSPVRMTSRDIDELDETTFTPDQIDLAALPGLMGMALEALDLEGEEVQSVSYDRLPGDPPRVYIAVDGLRGSGRLIANADGSDPTVRRN